jgi:putative transposase
MLTGIHRERAPVYQGRFKSFPVQTDEHFLTVARYVERNVLRAKLVGRSEHWQWSSLSRFVRANGKPSDLLNDWRMERPKSWIIRERIRERI